MYFYPIWNWGMVSSLVTIVFLSLSAFRKGAAQKMSYPCVFNIPFILSSGAETVINRAYQGDGVKHSLDLVLCIYILRKIFSGSAPQISASTRLTWQTSAAQSTRTFSLFLLPMTTQTRLTRTMYGTIHTTYFYTIATRTKPCYEQQAGEHFVACRAPIPFRQRREPKGASAQFSGE